MLDFLRNELAARKLRNPNYSTRAFAKDLQVDSSVLSKVMGGKRALSFEFARRILDRLGPPLAERQALLLSLDNPEGSPTLNEDLPTGPMAYGLFTFVVPKDRAEEVGVLIRRFLAEISATSMKIDAADRDEVCVHIYPGRQRHGP